MHEKSNGSQPDVGEYNTALRLIAVADQLVASPIVHEDKNYFSCK